MSVSLGVAGALGPDLIGALAPHIEAAGFDTLWVNDTPAGDALVALAAAARTTDRLRLATGVIPVDRRSAEQVAADIRRLDLPLSRLTVGIGSGGLRRGAVDLVGAAADELRVLPPARVAIGALGPRMRRLATERADDVVLNWLTPEVAAEQASVAEARVVLYVRTALDPAASARLSEEAARYASYPNYAANFARTATDPGDTVIDGANALADRLPAYREAVDEVVLRAITPDDSPAAYRAFIDAAAAAL